jgi:hypothetical protein
MFSTPNHHPKSQPFVDRVITFSVLDNRIWFRNFQILSEDGALAEIGPRFVLNPIKIFDGSFQGQTIWENPKYVSPALVIYILCYLMLCIEVFIYHVHWSERLIQWFCSRVLTPLHHDTNRCCPTIWTPELTGTRNQLVSCFRSVTLRSWFCALLSILVSHLVGLSYTRENRKVKAYTRENQKVKATSIAQL